MDERRLDAVLFDFGGVLSTSPLALMASRMDEFQLTREQFMPIVLGPLHEDGDHPWHRAERGELDLAGFDIAAEPLWRAAGHTEFPSPPSVDELLASIGPAPEMVAVARDARSAGYRTAIVSNMVSDWSAWRTVIDADALVDVVIDSSDVGLRKPSEAIFRLALDRLGVRAERSIFLDDFEWNLLGAAAIGMHTMHVTDTVAAAAELRERLGLPARP
ncbi:HAD family hydrolase [Ilumatobacter sp.]|uniref:HAD family hydrolase n=1 Tax=Ilumatobacter sp. TaxID=1967498 RepID=UPI003AF479C6